MPQTRIFQRLRHCIADHKIHKLASTRGTGDRTDSYNELVHVSKISAPSRIKSNQKAKASKYKLKAFHVEPYLVYNYGRYTEKNIEGF